MSNKKYEPYWKYEDKLKNYDFYVYKDLDNTYSAVIIDNLPEYRKNSKNSKRSEHLYLDKYGFKNGSDAKAYLKRKEEKLPDLECPEGYHFVKRHYRNIKGNVISVGGHCVKNKEVKK